MSQRIILVTGANKGIGFEAVKLLSNKHPEDVILLGTRDLNNGKQAIEKARKEPNQPMSNVKLVPVDVTKQETIQSAVNEIQREYGRLDVLISNSGISTSPTAKNQDSSEAADYVFDVNIRGVQRVNHAFEPLLKKSKKPIIIIVGSTFGCWHTHMLMDHKLKQLLSSPDQWNENTVNVLEQDCMKSFDGKSSTVYSWTTNPPDSEYRVYGFSKAIVNIYALYYARAHPEFKVALICPGYCATDLNGFAGVRPAAEGGASAIWPVENEFESGQFYKDGKVSPLVVAPGTN